MKKKRLIKILLVIVLILVANIGVVSCFDLNPNKEIQLTYTTLSDKEDEQQVYYSADEEFGEEQSITQKYYNINNAQEMSYKIPRDVSFIRLDTGMSPGNIWIKNIKIKYGYKNVFFDNSEILLQKKSNDITEFNANGEWVTIKSIGNDPFFELNISDSFNADNIDKLENTIKYMVCLFVNIIFFVVIVVRKKIKSLLREIYKNRHLIWNLSLNDFKTKYAGSYLGIFWAFVQPIVTTLIYWFVFDFGFKAAPADANTPFILWLIAGIVPWFFYAEALMNATNSLLEYSYLVKKVLFKISILPVVKIVASFFIHIFFLGIVLIIYMLYGHFPTLYFIQIIYYVFCTFALVLGLAYITSSVIVFFKDLGQIINVFLQIGMWLTPIMWNQNIISEKYYWILKLNPIYYIVEGYRDCFINKVWFWNKIIQTSYFWCVTVGCFFIGIMIFKKLKNHFADVL
ncbi:ABC transporter permease [Clostridium beijerinckii]|nr:ABC transporter permease [Clostridium beijerinckii]